MSLQRLNIRLWKGLDDGSVDARVYDDSIIIVLPIRGLGTITFAHRSALRLSGAPVEIVQRCSTEAASRSREPPLFISSHRDTAAYPKEEAICVHKRGDLSKLRCAQTSEGYWAM